MWSFGWPWAKRSSHAFARASPVQMTTRKPLLITVPFVKIKCGLQKLRRSCSFCPACVLTHLPASQNCLLAGTAFRFQEQPTGRRLDWTSFSKFYLSANPSALFPSIAVRWADKAQTTISFLSLSMVLHPTNGSLLLQLVLGEYVR